MRPARQDYAGEYERVVLEEELTGGLRELSRREGTTLYMTVLAGWAALLGGSSGEGEVVIGTPTANRGRAEIEEPDWIFCEHAGAADRGRGKADGEGVAGGGEEAGVRSAVASGHSVRAGSGVGAAGEELGAEPDIPGDVCMAEQGEGKLELPGLQMGAVGWSGHRVAKFDITVSLQEMGEKVVGGIEYATSLFERGTIQRYVGYMKRLLEGMVANEREEVGRLSMLSAEEREQVVYGWNETGVEYPREKCVHELFEEQVERQPEAVAVVYGEECLSYGELNRRANRLGHYLRRLGVRPDSRVAVCMERSVELEIGLLGVLKAGGAYVPLDPGYPEERLRYMLEDSQPVALLTERHLRGQFSEMCAGVPMVDVKEEAGQWESVAGTNVDGKSIGLTSRHLAYVIYTSGSTGQPKGVAIEHRNTVNLICWARMSFPKEVLEETLFSNAGEFRFVGV